MLQRIIDELSDSSAYPHSASNFEIHHTHASVVFLAGDFAYKLKKPLDLEFFDYSTLEKRRHFCRREVKLNERLAEDVYLDVVPVVERDGQLRVVVEAGLLRGEREVSEHEVVEWAVRMKRLDDEDTLLARMARGAIPPGLFDELGRRIAEFHNGADRGEHISEYARYAVVEKNALDNFRQSQDHVGDTVEPEVFDRLEQLTRKHLDELRPLIEKRAEDGTARDTHGDLRLEHVYVGDYGLRIVDCIEFDEAFRYADPVSDIAFLAMDLGFRGWDDEAAQLLDSYFDELADDEGRQLVDFYVAYRSCVRAKVHGLKALEEEVPDEECQRAHQKARAHWLYALSRLESPGGGPELILLAGLPAAGKSTLGRRMVDGGEADVLFESDVVRKQLAGIDPEEDAEADFGEGIYTREFSRRTYAEVARRAEEKLAKGRRIAVAATFVTDERRRQFIDVARRMGVPVRFIECRISDELTRRRLRERSGDVSDADIEVYEKLKELWETPSPPVARVHEVRDTSG